MIDERDRLVIGAPGGLAYWTFEVLKALASRCRPRAVPVVAVDRLDTVPPSEPTGPGRLLLFHYPTNQAIEALAAISVRAVYLAEPPKLSVHYLIAATNRTALEAIRVCTASYVANIALRQAPRAVVLHRSSPAPIPQLVRGLCSYLDLTPDEAELDAYAHHLTRSIGTSACLDEAVAAFMAASNAAAAAGDAATSDLANADALIASILDPLDSLLKSRAITSIEWPPASLTWSSLPPERYGQSIELVGPARMLCHGPYLHLPPASYDVDVVIEVSGPKLDATFRLEIHAGERCLARARMQPLASGRFKGRLGFDHTRPEPEVQAQIIIERGAIDGEFSLIALTLTPRIAD